METLYDKFLRLARLMKDRGYSEEPCLMFGHPEYGVGSIWYNGDKRGTGTGGVTISFTTLEEGKQELDRLIRYCHGGIL